MSVYTDLLSAVAFLTKSHSNKTIIQESENSSNGRTSHPAEEKAVIVPQPQNPNNTAFTKSSRAESADCENLIRTADKTKGINSAIKEPRIDGLELAVVWINAEKVSDEHSAK